MKSLRAVFDVFTMVPLSVSVVRWDAKGFVVPVDDVIFFLDVVFEY